MNTTLEQRITTALKADDVKSEDLVALNVETEAAVAAADEAATKTREQALDPLISPDETKARAAMESAAFTRDRLRTVLPRLQQRLQDVQAQEYATRWHADCDEAAIVRDKLAAELQEFYAPVAERLADLMSRIATCDEEVTRIGGNAPSGERRRLAKVELAARNLASFTRAVPSIVDTLCLPPWSPGAPEWPMARPFNATIAAACAPRPFDRRYSPDWWQVKEEEARALREQQERDAAEREAKALENYRGPRWWERERA